ncbi:type VII secretion target [Actinoplanes sp. NPDC024001]|uniref:type VII secretion target n=1 Tax=Actinoplanes sp. NPDC024001 TaxID=3154598 RepID=UPI0033ED5117
MVFHADDAAIRSFGHRCGGLIDDAEQAVGYVNNALSINDRSTGMFAHVVSVAEGVREALTANYRHLAMIVDLSATELTKAANTYRDTDEASAREIDSTYGAAGKVPI